MHRADCHWSFHTFLTFYVTCQCHDLCFIICSNYNFFMLHANNSKASDNNSWSTLFQVLQINIFAAFTQHLHRYTVDNEIKWSLVEYFKITASLLCVEVTLLDNLFSVFEIEIELTYMQCWMRFCDNYVDTSGPLFCVFRLVQILWIWNIYKILHVCVSKC